MDDLISRQAAIDAVNEYLRISEVSKTVQNMTSIQAILRWLPSAEPKKGRWIKISPAGIYECSQCGQNVMTGDIEVYAYCHHCGTRMGGEEE